MDAEQFLNRAVAPGNYIVVNWKDPSRKGMAVRFFPRDNARDAAGFLRWISGKGSDAYFAVASFTMATPDGTDTRGKPKYKGNRVHENAQMLRAFWIDIDVKRAGDKKGSNIYADRREALEWLVSFRKAVGLPLPNLWVDSGYGYHTYFILEDPMSVADWQPYADALAAALRTHGFKCEAGISSDASRILRPPETANRKADTPAPVRVLGQYSRGDYPNQLILDKLQPYVGQAQAQATSNYYSSGNGALVLAGGAPAALLQGAGPNMNAAAQANLAVLRHHEFAKIATRCAQVGQSLAAGGAGDPYQLWYLGFLSLAHHCVDGADFVHQMSQGDPRYSQQQTDTFVARIATEKAKKDTGPPKCTSFDQWRSGVCSGCPHIGKIVSPWNLGADDDGAAQAVVASAVVEMHPGVISALPSEMTPEQALQRANQMFFYAHDWGGEPLVGHAKPDGVRALSEKQLRAMLANRYVEVPATDSAGKSVGVKRMPFGTWWLAHPQRREYDRVIYDPEGTRAVPGERILNLWTGFAKTPRPGSWKLMARHIHSVICRRDRRAWRYLVHWLAHAVQHPGTAPGTVPVLKSDSEGTGKSTMLEWMARMFGEHALMLSTPEDLIGQFNDHLESKSLLGLNEPSFPGDHRAAGKLKSMITEPTWLLNGKFRAARRVPNIAHILLTTNASWAVTAGNQARRFFVLDVDERRAGDRAYFNAIWAEAETGGIEAMLHALLRVDLRGFSLLDMPRTQALRLQQVRSAPTTTQWALDAATARELIPAPIGSGFGFGFGAGAGVGGGFKAKHHTTSLYDAYKRWASDMRQRPVSHVEFGKWLNRCGFPRTMVRGAPTYDIPDADAFGAAVLRQAGIV